MPLDLTMSKACRGVEECPSCASPGVLVTDSRLVESVRFRRRHCPGCDARWCTAEIRVDELRGVLAHLEGVRSFLTGLRR